MAGQGLEEAGRGVKAHPPAGSVRARPCVTRLPALSARTLSRNALPYLHGREAAAVARVLASGHYTHGPETELFERELAAFLGVPDVVAVAFGTAALHIALLAAGIGPGKGQVPAPSCKTGSDPQTCRRHGQPATIQPQPQARTDPERRTAGGVTPASRRAG
jgi:DegT/DnrJ/EryC1/StrS aminotransferase family